jgi:soluble P-type ATPase
MVNCHKQCCLFTVITYLIKILDELVKVLIISSKRIGEIRDTLETLSPPLFRIRMTFGLTFKENLHGFLSDSAEFY